MVGQSGGLSFSYRIKQTKKVNATGLINILHKIPHVPWKSIFQVSTANPNNYYFLFLIICDRNYCRLPTSCYIPRQVCKVGTILTHVLQCKLKYRRFKNVLRSPECGGYMSKNLKLILFN